MRTGDKDEREVMTVVSVSSRLQVETERVQTRLHWTSQPVHTCLCQAADSKEEGKCE